MPVEFWISLTWAVVVLAILGVIAVFWEHRVKIFDSDTSTRLWTLESRADRVDQRSRDLLDAVNTNTENLVKRLDDLDARLRYQENGGRD